MCTKAGGRDERERASRLTHVLMVLYGLIG